VHPAPTDSARSVWKTPTILCLILAAIAFPIILFNCNNGRGANDQNTYHLNAIRSFARQWPHFDFSDYSSATTPGYHLALAAVDRVLSDDVRMLRMAGTFFSFGLLATLAICVARYCGTIEAVLLCMPCVCSLYIISSCAWLLPDNAGWWGMLGVLLIALRPTVDRWSYLLGGFLLLLLVFVRQEDLWVAAPLCIAAWIGNEKTPSQETASVKDSFRITSAFSGPGCVSPVRAKLRTRACGTNRIGRLAMMLLATLPAIAIIIAFARIWHGMMPPSQRVHVAGANPAAPAMALAVAGALGIFFLPLLCKQVSSARSRLAILAGALLGGIIGVLPVTTYNVPAGRYSGIWNAVPRLPVVCQRSLLIVAMSMIGGAVVALWLSALPPRPRWIWLAAILGFGAAQAAGHNAFQRYDEPMILLAAAVSVAPFARSAGRWALVGPILLSAILAGISAMTLR